MIPTLRSFVRSLFVLIAFLCTGAYALVLPAPDAYLHLPDGRIMTASGAGMLAVARLLPDGTLDPEYAFGNGHVMHMIPSPPGGGFKVAAVLALPGGKTLIVGRGYSHIVFARLDEHGSLDATFGSANPGWVFDDVPFGLKTAVLEPSGSIVGAGDYVAPAG